MGGRFCERDLNRKDALSWSVVHRFWTVGANEFAPTGDSASGFRFVAPMTPLWERIYSRNWVKR